MRKHGAGDGKVIGTPQDPNGRGMPAHIRDIQIKKAEEKRKMLEKELEKEKK